MLESDPHVSRVRLEPGMGTVGNNRLHDGAAFTDSATHRWLVPNVHLRGRHGRRYA
jgi:hypothetical protein